MAITKNLNFSAEQLALFARLFKDAREAAGLTQMQLARRAFRYRKSHCKVSRVERSAMPKVDAHCLQLMALALDIPEQPLQAIDPLFAIRVAIAREATRAGFWRRTAALQGGRDPLRAFRVHPAVQA